MRDDLIEFRDRKDNWNGHKREKKLKMYTGMRNVMYQKRNVGRTESTVPHTP